MVRPLDGDYVHWMARITIRRPVEEAVRSLAHKEMRSASMMLGILIAEALAARKIPIKAEEST